MPLRCDHCRRPLVRKRVGGKLTWRCRYSHRRRRSFAPSSRQICPQCRKHPSPPRGVVGSACCTDASLRGTFGPPNALRTPSVASLGLFFWAICPQNSARGQISCSGASCRLSPKNYDIIAASSSPCPTRTARCSGWGPCPDRDDRRCQFAPRRAYTFILADCVTLFQYHLRSQPMTYGESLRADGDASTADSSLSSLFPVGCLCKIAALCRNR